MDQLPLDWFLGVKADVYIETARRQNALQVPVTAIVRHGDQPGVFVVNNGRARWRPIQIGLTGRDTVEVASGIGIPDLVITNPWAGKKPVTDGQRVTPVIVKERP